MITPSFTKLQRSIITSSIWLQDDQTRIVWVTLLALCDRDGMARCSPMGLAHQARVSPEACDHAVEVLSSRDPDSRDNGDGCRIERCPGGFIIVNYLRVLAEGNTEEKRRKEREKKAAYRARKKGLMTGLNTPREDNFR